MSSNKNILNQLNEYLICEKNKSHVKIKFKYN